MFLTAFLSSSQHEIQLKTFDFFSCSAYRWMRERPIELADCCIGRVAFLSRSANGRGNYSRRPEDSALHLC